MKTAIVIPTIKKIPDEIMDLNPDTFIFIRDSEIGEVMEWNYNKRRQWFMDLMGRDWAKYEQIIPRKVSGCRCFGFLLAYQRDYEKIITMDDDCYPGKNFIEEHLIGEERTFNTLAPRTARGSFDFMNAMSMLELKGYEHAFQRGYPFSQRDNPSDTEGVLVKGKVMCNIGLWTLVPDVDACDKLQAENSKIGQSLGLKRGINKLIIPKGVNALTCSMNLSFHRDLIPAFYQPIQNVPVMPGYHVSRRDDIWSGIILKKLMDIKGDLMTTGTPLVEHQKQGTLWRELREEIPAMMMDDLFLLLVNQATKNVKEGSYRDMYKEFAERFVLLAKDWGQPYHKRYFTKLGDFMLKWIEIIDKIDEAR